MTSLTIATVLVVVYGVLNRRGYGRALALSGVTAAGAAVVVGDTAVPTFYAVALGTVVALAVSLLGDGRSVSPPRRPLPPGASLLMAFFAWSAFITLVAPLVFDGMAIVTPGTPSLVAGVITPSNAAQLIYLFIGICVVVFLARSRLASPGLLGIAAGLATLLSFWRYIDQAVGLPFPEGLFDNSPTFAYIEAAPNDVPRFRGIMSEPAALAGSSLITISYMLSRATQLDGWRRGGALVVAGIAVHLGVISTSASFVVAGVAVAAIVGLTFLFGFLMRRTRFSALVSLFGCGIVIAALWLLPIIADFVEATVNEKVGSSSYEQRSGADSRSYVLFLDTFGMGVGLGASRASSFLPTLLGATGLVGTLLLAAAIATLIHRGAAVRAYRPVVWALVALLVTKIVAGPDLSDSSGILWMSLGLLSHAVTLKNAEILPAPHHGLASTTLLSPRATVR